MTRFQKVATGALISLLLLIVMGAVVRVSGAGMGCPDWPTCWGCLVPPTKLEDVDFSKLKIEKFQQKAAREGRDPNSITLESLRSEFNARLAWTEYINRLCTTPLAILTLATLVMSFAFKRERPLVFWASFGSFALLLVNAWMGARIVHSGLKPGIITAHLAMAMAMCGMLTYCAWRGGDSLWSPEISAPALPRLRIAVLVLLGIVIAEGIMGSQIRELTDGLAKQHHHAPRSEWISELEQQPIYLVHRSFSWAVLLAAAWAYRIAMRHGRAGRVGQWVLGIVLGQMVLGVIMSQIHLYAWVQLLHVVLSAILLTFCWLWVFGAWAEEETRRLENR